MKYAVIRIGGSQYKVSEGDEILVDKLAKGGLDFDVLLLADAGKVKIGRPKLKEAKVKLKVVNPEEKGKKLTVFKYKAKSRYRRKYGFRPLHTRLLVEQIS